MIGLVFHKAVNFHCRVSQLSVCIKMSRRSAKTQNTEIVEKKKKVAVEKPVESVAKNGKEKENVVSEGDSAGEVTPEVRSHAPDGRQYNFKIASWNVAGVRAWVKKEGHKWLVEESPDVICLQETKCSEKDIPQPLKDMKDYNLFWNVAKSTKGFSGVALLSKVKPIKVDFGIGVEEHDQEGRTITAEYEKFYLVTSYVPNSGRGLKRLEYRMKWNDEFLAYVKGLDEQKPVVLCGDLNVSHLEIDLANPKQNKRGAGFTQEERDGMSTFLESGFVDTYRHLYPDLIKKYTFWTYMGNARARNVGWRLDYYIVSKRWVENVCDNLIASSVMGSDHCPITLLLAIP